MQAASESLKGMETTSSSHTNRIVGERYQTVARKWINSLDSHKAYQLRRILGMRKAIKDASKNDASGIRACK
jgi:hypothetical protein